jgi:hypothetical protein
MTPTHPRLKRSPAPGPAHELPAGDPSPCASKEVLRMPAPLDGEADASRLDRTANLWTGVHWYHALLNERIIEPG